MLQYLCRRYRNLYGRGGFLLEFGGSRKSDWDFDEAFFAGSTGRSILFFLRSFSHLGVPAVGAIAEFDKSKQRNSEEVRQS